MFKRSTFTINKDVEVEVTIDDVLENVDANALFEALMQEGSVDASTIVGDLECDEVLDNFQQYEVISWAVTNLDTDEVLDAFKESDPDGVHEWLKANDDIVNPDWNPNEEEPKPEPIPLVRPVVSMNEGRVLVAGRADSLEPLSVFDAGTYTTFNGMLYVDAIGVKFVVDSTQSAEAILGAIAFAQANVNKEV